MYDLNRQIRVCNGILDRIRFIKNISEPFQNEIVNTKQSSTSRICEYNETQQELFNALCEKTRVV